jgi:DNA-binding winged helix-turn-helix (wHTH) protein/Tfp pilus assembly protein PilF
MKSPFYVGEWLVEPDLNRISRNGEVVHLEPKVICTLLHLSQHAGSLVEKDVLFKAVWGEAYVTDDVLTRCVFQLRKALKDDSRTPRFIQTVPKGGYRLVAPVRQAAAPKGRSAVNKRTLLKTICWIAIGLIAITIVVHLLLLKNRRNERMATAKSERAHDLFLKAQQYCDQATLSLWDENGSKAPSRALMYYAEAIKDDPYNAEIHAGLAECYDHLVDREKMQPIQGWTNARIAAGKALAINSHLSAPRIALGKAKLFLDHNWLGAESDFRQAVDSDPENVEAKLTLAEHLCRSGKSDEARVLAKQLRDSKLLAPEIAGRLGTVFFYLRQYADAEEELKRAIGLDANNPLPHYWLSILYETEHRYPEWLDQRLRAFQSSGKAPESIEMFRRAYLKGGYEAFWRVQLEAGREWADRHPESALTLNYARILLRLHDKELALHYLKQALEEGDPDLFDLAVDPLYDPVRSDPRFRDALRQLGIVPSPS